MNWLLTIFIDTDIIYIDYSWMSFGYTRNYTDVRYFERVVDLAREAGRLQTWPIMISHQEKTLKKG